MPGDILLLYGKSNKNILQNFSFYVEDLEVILVRMIK